ncbi:MAG TPA: response regulator [Longimicrobiales bacterium]
MSKDIERSEQRREGAGPERGTAPTLALVADLLFASRVRGAAEAAGVRVKTVRSVGELLDAAKEEMPRLILLDLDARGADVPSLVRELKAEPSLAGVPVVVFGAHVRGDALRAARDAGADRVLARSAFVRDLPALLRGADPAEPST